MYLMLIHMIMETVEDGWMDDLSWSQLTCFPKKASSAQLGAPWCSNNKPVMKQQCLRTLWLHFGGNPGSFVTNLIQFVRLVHLDMKLDIQEVTGAIWLLMFFCWETNNFSRSFIVFCFQFFSLPCVRISIKHELVLLMYSCGSEELLLFNPSAASAPRCSGSQGSRRVSLAPGEWVWFWKRPRCYCTTRSEIGLRPKPPTSGSEPSWWGRSCNWSIQSSSEITSEPHLTQTYPVPIGWGWTHHQPIRVGAH